MSSVLSAVIFPGNKLSSSELISFRPIPIKAFKSAQLTLGPVYVHLKKNQKLIAIKSALNIFTDTELAKYETYQALYLPESILVIEQFIQSAKLVKSLLQSSEVISLDGNGSNQNVNLKIHPSSLNRVVYDSVRPLFRKTVALDAFPLVFFVNTLCGEPSSDWLFSAFEEDVEQAQLSLLRSSLSVVVELLSGYCDLDYLIHKRDRLLIQDDQSIGKYLVSDYSKQYFEAQELSKIDHPAVQAFLTRMSEKEEPNEQVG